MIYVLQVVWLALSAMFCYSIKQNKAAKDKLFVFLAFTFCFVMMGFRNISVGVDTAKYALYYEGVANASWVNFSSQNSFEFGWNLFMKICSIISSNYYFFQIVYAAVFCVLSARFILRFSDNVVLTTILFFGLGLFTTAFNIQRQMLAVILLANSYWHITKGNRIKSLILILVAVSLHTTAILFFAAYIAYFLRRNKRILKFVPIVFVIVAINYQSIIELARILVPSYHNYYANYKTIQSAGGVWLIWIAIICISISSIYMLKRKKNIGIDSQRDMMLYGIFSLVYITCNIVGLYFNYFERLGLYFWPFVVVLLDRYPLYLRRSTKQIYVCGMIVFFVAYYLLSCFTGNKLEYSFFF